MKLFQMRLNSHCGCSLATKFRILPQVAAGVFLPSPPPLYIIVSATPFKLVKWA